MKQKGQTILILLLVLAVGLGVGLSVIQRSLSDISSATKVEQSSRAFSAAEAGIERALRTDSSLNSASLDNDSQIEGVERRILPLPNQALEYPPVGKEDLAQFWLVDPADINLAKYYDQSSIHVYWGIVGLPDEEKPAIEIDLTYQRADNGQYANSQYLIDSLPSRISINNFSDPTSFPSSGCGSYTIALSSTEFYCKVTLPNLNILPGGVNKLIMLRTRLLYSGVSQPVAVAPNVTALCNTACSLPPQARVFTSVGSSGETKRLVQIFKLDKVVPFYFDYAIFSQADIIK